MIRFLAGSAIALYLVPFARNLFARPKRLEAGDALEEKWGLGNEWRWFLGAALVHLTWLGWAGWLQGLMPGTSMRIGLGTMAFVVVVTGLVLGSKPKMHVLKMILVIVGVVLLGVSQLAPMQQPPADYKNLWLPLHLGLIFIGIASFTVAFALSVLYLAVRRRLKSQRLQGIVKLPSLAILDQWNANSMVVGFVALTFGGLLGALWGESQAMEHESPDLTIYITVCLWIWYAVGLHTRVVVGWRGRVGAIFGVVGFAGFALLVASAWLFFGAWHGFGVSQ